MILFKITSLQFNALLKRIMRLFGALFIMTLMLFSCNLSNRYPEITFEKTAYDFEFIAHENPIEAIFKFHNSGTGDLLVTNIKTSCGCTTPEWPQEKIKPGESGEIKVIFDAERLGRFNKTINVFCNKEQKSAQTLYIKGFVKYTETD